MNIDPSFLIQFVVFLIPFSLSWGINQLPSLQPVPGKNVLIITNIFVLSFLATEIEWTLPENPEPYHLQTQQVIEWLKFPCYVIFICSALYLVGMSWLQRKNAPNSPNQPTHQEALDWRTKLLKVQEYHVTTRLKDALHRDELILLVAESQPEYVGKKKKSPLASSPEPSLQEKLQKSFNKIFRRKDPEEKGKTIWEVFQESEQRLLILGEPGSGKTTLLLDLAKKLIADAQQYSDCPLPVIFELSGWKQDKQSIAEWLAADLKYRHNIPLNVTRSWLEQGQLVPLLDGLDELGLVHQKACIERLKEFLDSKWQAFPVVICCRYEEYLAGDNIIRGLRGAVCLQPLTDRQIKAYLNNLNCPNLWQNIQKDKAGLLALARIPLFLHLIPVA
ncbi:MAG: NACHT domain-containing protein, partial [Planktothrix sp.]